MHAINGGIFLKWAKREDYHKFSESAEHLAGKSELADYFRTHDFDVRFEQWLAEIKQRPDLLITKGTLKIAIEYQCSDISQLVIRQRTSGYKRSGLRVVWVPGRRLRAKERSYCIWNKFSQRYRETLGLFELRGGRLIFRTWEWCEVFQFDSLRKEADLLQREVSRGHRQWRAIISELYQQKRVMSGIPWECHVPRLTSKNLRSPSWLMNLDILLQLEKSSMTITEITSELRLNNWDDYALLSREVNQQCYVSHVLKVWLLYGIVECNGDIYYLKSGPRWFPDTLSKIQALTGWLDRFH